MAKRLSDRTVEKLTSHERFLNLDNAEEKEKVINKCLTERNGVLLLDILSSMDIMRKAAHSAARIEQEMLAEDKPDLDPPVADFTPSRPLDIVKSVMQFIDEYDAQEPLNDRDTDLLPTPDLPGTLQNALKNVIEKLEK